MIKTIYNYKYDDRYWSIIKQYQNIAPSDDEMILAVFKQFRKVIDKENILTAL